MKLVKNYGKFVLVGMLLIFTACLNVSAISAENKLIANDDPNPNLYVWPDSDSTTGVYPGPVYFDPVYVRNNGDMDSNLEWSATISGNKGDWKIAFFDQPYQGTLSGSLHKTKDNNLPSTFFSARVTNLPTNFRSATATITVTGNGQTEIVDLTLSQKQSKSFIRMPLLYEILFQRYSFLFDLI